MKVDLNNNPNLVNTSNNTKQNYKFQKPCIGKLLCYYNNIFIEDFEQYNKYERDST